MSRAEPSPAATAKAEFEVNGMTCGGCASSVRRALEGLPGVSDVNVTLSPGHASLRYDAGRVSPIDLHSAVEEAGFEVVPSVAGTPS